MIKPFSFNEDSALETLPKLIPVTSTMSLTLAIVPIRCASPLKLQAADEYFVYQQAGNKSQHCDHHV
jgi:hypothetical protein